MSSGRVEMDLLADTKRDRFANFCEAESSSAVTDTSAAASDETLANAVPRTSKNYGGEGRNVTYLNILDTS